MRLRYRFTFSLKFNIINKQYRIVLLGKIVELGETMKKQKWKKIRTTYFDYELLLIIIFLSCFGLIMLYSTSSYSGYVNYDDDMFYFTKQMIFTIISFVGMWIVIHIDYHIYGAFSNEIFWASMFLMLLVQTPLGYESMGARRWIQLPGNLTLQPAEITKIAVIILISCELCRVGKKITTKDGIFKILIYGIIAALGVRFFTENLSTAIIVFSISCVLLFVAHPKTKPFIKILVICVIAAIVGMMVLTYTVKSSDNFRLNRVLTWIDPENKNAVGGFQVLQGLYAIGSGGFWGKGLGNSSQKLGVIPEVQNDMILSVICEELGVFGVIVILFLFGALIYRIMFIAQNAPDMFGSLLAVGVMTHISIQVILNIAVVTNMIPTTGITLPFFSYGGTSIIFLMAEMGIVLGISTKIKIEDK